MKIAVLGAVHQSGREILACLEERDFPVDEVIVAAGRRHLGVETSYGDRTLKMRDIEEIDWSAIDLCLMSPDAADARLWAQRLTDAGVFVIDGGRTHRRDPLTPLLVAEVNAGLLGVGHPGRLIAAPGPVATQLAIALKPLHDAAGVRRAVVSTYQAVSSAGRDALDELWTQTKGIFVNQAPEPRAFAKQIAFNVIPQIGDVRPDGLTTEEADLAHEVARVVDPDLSIVATCVQAPVFVGHGAAVHLELASPLAARDARALLREAPGIMVVDKSNEEGVVTPIETVGEWAVFISRIRADHTVDNGLAMWVVADDLRKGSALNLVMLAEIAMARGLMDQR